MPRFVRTVTKGKWMVLVPGAFGYLRYRGAPNPRSPVAIYDLLEELGFLEDVDRSRDSILGTIRNRLGKRYQGLVAE